MKERQSPAMTSIMRIVTEQRNELEDSYWSDGGMSTARRESYLANHHEQNPLELLSGNTILANQDDSAKLQTPLKAPKKSKKRMKTAKRLKIFGSMRKGNDKRKQKQISNSTSNDSRDWDFTTLGVRRFKDDERNDAILMSRSSPFDHGYKPRYHNASQNRQVHQRDVFVEPNIERRRCNDSNHDLLNHSKSAEFVGGPQKFHLPDKTFSRDQSQSTQRSSIRSDNAISRNVKGNIDMPYSKTVHKVRSRSQSTNRSLASTAMMTKSAEVYDDDIGLSTSQSQLSCQNSTINSNFKSNSYETFGDHFNLLSMKSSSDFAQSGSVEHFHDQLSDIDNYDTSKLYVDKNRSEQYQNQSEHFLDNQTQVSALSMNSPTTASNRSYPTVRKDYNILRSQKKTENPSNNPFFCHFPNVQCHNVKNITDYDEGSSDSSDSIDSSIIELTIGGDIVLPNTSSLSSQSTDLHLSDEEDDETENNEDLEQESASTSTSTCKSAYNHRDGKHFIVARKIFSVMQGKLADCLLPPLNSPPQQSQNIFW